MTKIYSTVQGDTWDGIAKKQLGSEYCMADLIRANLTYRNVIIFPDGISLTIPDVDTSEIPLTLPPWKQGGSSA